MVFISFEFYKFIICKYYVYTPFKERVGLLSTYVCYPVGGGLVILDSVEVEID